MAELSGRTVAYAYDDLWRLTGETITNTAQSGASSYQYDAVGTSRTSTIPNVPNSSSTFDDNDRLNSDLYDENGNTTGADGKTCRYDFENRLVGVNNGQIVVVYDGDGNRVGKTANGMTTKYLVDTNNHTGYAQVVEELTGASVVARVYAFGLDLISQDQPINNVWTESFYGYDGHGSVRFLTNAQGLVTDQYDFDAFGILISQAGNTPNSFLYCGEQFDADLGFYYLRARYMNAATGRFWTMDKHEGRFNDPRSLHKYIYCGADPANLLDPLVSSVLSKC